MRIFYDTEFHEDGRTIDLISIGMIDEAGLEYYAVSSEFDRAAVQRRPWLMENVWPHLPLTGSGALDLRHPDVKPRRRIRDEVEKYVLSHSKPELWAYYGAYDHVCLAQLFGRMIDLPAGFPMFTNDLMTGISRLGVPSLPEHEGDLHHALADARWNRTVAGCLDELERRRQALHDVMIANDALGLYPK